MKQEIVVICVQAVQVQSKYKQVTDDNVHEGVEGVFLGLPHSQIS